MLKKITYFLCLSMLFFNCSQEKNVTILIEANWGKDTEVEIKIERIKPNGFFIFSNTIAQGTTKGGLLTLKVGADKPTICMVNMSSTDKTKGAAYPIYLNKGNFKLKCFLEDGSPRVSIEGWEGQTFLNSSVTEIELLGKNYSIAREEKDTKKMKALFQSFQDIIAKVEKFEGRKDIFYMFMTAGLNFFEYHDYKQFYDGISAQNDHESDMKDIFVANLKKEKNTNPEDKQRIKGEYGTLEIFKKAKLQDVNGNIVDLEKLTKNKYVVVDFWASWCAPCIKEMPHYEKLQKKYGNRKDFVLISVSIDKNLEKWKTFLNKKKLPWLQLVDSDNLAKKLEITEIPLPIVFDNKGKMVGRGVLAEDIDNLLKANRF